MENCYPTLKEKLSSFDFQSLPPHYAIIPINDFQVYLSLCDESLKQIGRFGGDDLTVLCDSNTAVKLNELETIEPYVSKFVIYGTVPYFKNFNAEFLPVPSFLQPDDYIFLLISARFALLFLGSILRGKKTINNFDGGWSFNRRYVHHVLNIFHSELAKQYSPTIENIDEILDISTRIMSVQSTIIQGYETTAEMDKNELATVLNILKAVSSKRHAHDVLYIFVEKITQVIPSDRCSVVRIWGQENQAYVLASHDNESIYNMSIDLNKYPELRKALALGEKVIINNVKDDPLMEPCLDSLIRKGITSILVMPIVLYNAEIGSLFLRAVRRGGGFSLQEINFFEIVTNAAANALERAQLFESVQEANKKLEKLATTDGLTNLYNHRFFRERLEEEIHRSLRYRIPLSIAMFDIDNFKKCNDTYGHLFGDTVLREIATRMGQAVRKTDIVARYGGEEFVIIMPQTSIDGAVAQAERIRKLVEEKPFDYKGRPVTITISGGVAEVVHDQMLTVEDLLRVADQCLYEAKQKGKNRIVSANSLTQ